MSSPFLPFTQNLRGNDRILRAVLVYLWMDNDKDRIRRVRMDSINFNEKKGFICDMDGVIYHGNQILPGVAEFIQWLH